MDEYTQTMLKEVVLAVSRKIGRIGNSETVGAGFCWSVELLVEADVSILANPQHETFVGHRRQQLT